MTLPRRICGACVSLALGLGPPVVREAAVRRRRVGALAAVVLWTLSTAGDCGNGPSEPEVPAPGEYQLTSANGDGLPFLIEESPPNVFLRLLSASLTFHSRSRVFDRRLIQVLDTRVTPERVEIHGSEMLLSYVSQGNRVLITYPATPDAPAYTDTATVSEDGSHVLLRSRIVVPSGTMVLDLLYAKTP